jgi:hypothetical protein
MINNDQSHSKNPCETYKKIFLPPNQTPATYLNPIFLSFRLIYWLFRKKEYIVFYNRPKIPYINCKITRVFLLFGNQILHMFLLVVFLSIILFGIYMIPRQAYVFIINFSTIFSSYMHIYVLEIVAYLLQKKKEIVAY